MIIPSVTSPLKTSPMESYSMWEHTKRLSTIFAAGPACTFQNSSNTIMFAQSSYYIELTHGKITLLCFLLTIQANISTDASCEIQLYELDRPRDIKKKNWNLSWMCVKTCDNYRKYSLCYYTLYYTIKIPLYIVQMRAFICMLSLCFDTRLIIYLFIVNLTWKYIQINIYDLFHI